MSIGGGQFYARKLKGALPGKSSDVVHKSSPAAGLSRHLGNRIQSKLDISRPNDRYEREAGSAAIAEAVAQNTREGKQYNVKPRLVVIPGHAAEGNVLSYMDSGRRMDASCSDFSVSFL